MSIGCAITFSEIDKSEIINKYFPLLAKAAQTVGSLQIRNKATVVGNFVNNAPCADSVPPLLVYNASIKIVSPENEKIIPLNEFLLNPYETQLKKNECVTEIRIPILTNNFVGDFYKLGRRSAISISRISLAFLLFQENKIIKEFRVASGAITPIGKRVFELENFFIGQEANRETFIQMASKLGEQILKTTGLRWSTSYKLPVVQQMFYQLLEKNAGGNYRMTINFKLNGKETSVNLKKNKRLIDLLRDDLNLTGTKEGCSIGECGACTVIINGKAVNSCLVLAQQVDECEVLTVEGLAQGEKTHYLQQNFLKYGAIQCGFCTPGMLMSAYALFLENPTPSEEEVKTAIEGNLCRCTGYKPIIHAIVASARSESIDS